MRAPCVRDAGLEAGVRGWRPFMNFSAGYSSCAARDQLSRLLREEPAARACAGESREARRPDWSWRRLDVSAHVSPVPRHTSLAQAIAQLEVHAFGGPQVAR